MPMLLALPMYGPNNQITSVLVQLFFAKILNMTAVIPRRVHHHHIFNNPAHTMPSFADALRIREYEIANRPVTHAFYATELHVIGSTNLSTEPVVSQLARYRQSLDAFRADTIVQERRDFQTTDEIVERMKQLRHHNKHVMYTHYGARLFPQLHPGGPDISYTALEQQMIMFIKDIAPLADVPCDIGMHIRVFDTMAAVTEETRLDNLTYAFQFESKREMSTHTLGNLFQFVSARSSNAKIMIPPVMAPALRRSIEDRLGITFVDNNSLVDDQKEIAACKTFVGDSVSSVSTAVMRMRLASGMPQHSSMSLQEYIDWHMND